MQSQAPISPPIFISSNQSLVIHCKTMQTCQVLAIDTEFQRTDTFYPQAGLLQISDGQNSYIIDPLTIDDYTPLEAVFTDAAIVKVLHAGSEDLLLFKRLLGTLPRPLFDSQIAAALLGYGLSIGYSNLAKSLLGIELEKGETRSDWLSRPLSAAQIHYAVLDVVFLPKIYDLLQTQLQSMGRTLWLKEECERVQREIDLFEDYEDYYLKVKSAWKLNRCGLAILKELCFWREKEARKKDRPRNHIVKEVALWQIAHDKPTDITELYKIEDMSQRAIRQYGELLLDVVSQTQRLHEDNHPPLLLKPLPASLGPQVQALKSAVRIIAERMHIPAEMLVRKKEYEEIVRSGIKAGLYQLPDTMDCWRKQILAEEVITKLNLREPF